MAALLNGVPVAATLGLDREPDAVAAAGLQDQEVEPGEVELVACTGRWLDLCPGRSFPVRDYCSICKPGRRAQRRFS